MTRRPRLRVGVLGLAVVAGLALAPAVLPWAVEHPDRVCVALRDGWALERTRPDMSVRLHRLVGRPGRLRTPAQRRLAVSGAGIAAVAIATVPVLRRRR